VPTPFGELTFKPPEFPDRTADIRDFGAKEGGTVPAGGAIRAAVASIARAGGGRVEIPAGVWLTGPIHLESDVEIHLAKGAELRFSQDPADYLPVVFSRHEDVECMKYSAFIYADGKRNIAITGEGTLNGQGKPWWAWKTEKKAAEALLYAMGMKDVPVQERIFDGTDGRGLRVGKPTENIVVRNSRGFSGHGGIVIGSETSGGVRNVYAADCSFEGTDRMVRIKTARGRGGMIENMWFRNLAGTRILKEALHLNMLYTGTRLPAQPPGATTPAIRNITFENITVTAGQSWAIELLGLPERAIETVRFDGVTASAKRGIHVADARGVTFTGVALTLTAADSAAVLLDEARAATFDRLTADGPFGRLLQAEGAGSEAIVLRGTRVPPDGIKLGRGVKPAAVTVER